MFSKINWPVTVVMVLPLLLLAVKISWQYSRTAKGTCEFCGDVSVRLVRGACRHCRKEGKA